MTAKLVYKGNLMCELTHERSGTTITTDAPVDNKGNGSAFSPTDLLCAAAASCMVTTIAILAPDLSAQLAGSEMDIVKVMASDPRRVAEIKIDFRINGPALGEFDKRRIESIAANCPVVISLHPDIKKTITFRWPQG